MFCYCLNNPVNMVDTDGTDAVVLSDNSSCTHIGALIQDGNGDWWHFYWGASHLLYSWQITGLRANSWCDWGLDNYENI